MPFLVLIIGRQDGEIHRETRQGREDREIVEDRGARAAGRSHGVEWWVAKLPSVGLNPGR